MNPADLIRGLWARLREPGAPLASESNPFLQLINAFATMAFTLLLAIFALVEMVIGGGALLLLLALSVVHGIDRTLSASPTWFRSLSKRDKATVLTATLVAALSPAAVGLLKNYVLALLLILIAGGIAAPVGMKTTARRQVQIRLAGWGRPIGEWISRHRLLVVVLLTSQSALTFGVVGWLAWAGQLHINPVLGALATPLAAIEARYLLAALTSWVGERIRGRVEYQAWLIATLKQFRQVPLTTGLGYLLGALFLSAYLLTWHGGPVAQRAVLYLFQAGIGGVGTNVVVALATVQGRDQQQPLPQPEQVSARRQRWRMAGLVAMLLTSIIPVMLILFLFITVGLLGHQGGYIGSILTVMIVGIAGLTAALTNWFTYTKQIGRPPITSWKPQSWGDEDWQRLGELASLYWRKELIPGVLRTGAFFLGFPIQGFYQSTAVKPVQQVAQLVLSASQQAFAAVLNLPAVAIRNAPAGWIRSLIRKARSLPRKARRKQGPQA